MASRQLHRVKLVPNPKYKRSGPKSYVFLLNKYSFTPTLEGPYQRGNKLRHQGKFGIHRLVGGRTRVQSVLQKTTADGTAGEVTAEDQQNDSEYLCPVTIGTPGKTFNLDFDTGSADLWIFSTLLPKATVTAAQNSHTIYNSKDSSTYTATKGASWKISYGDGSAASGTVATDNVEIGGLTIQNQTIELAKTLSAQFSSGVGDGLLGLAFSAINTVTPGPAHTPVENMISQADISSSEELFTANLGSWRDANDPDKGESFYTFGYIDPAPLKAAGVTEPYYTPVDSSQGFWMFDSASASVNGTAIPRSGNTAIADTGTTLALVDDATCKAIYAAIPGSTYDNTQQGYIFPSTVTADQLPVVTFAVGGQQFAVQKEDLAFADAGNGNVYGGIQSRGDMTFDILGDTFLKSIYAVRYSLVCESLPFANHFPQIFDLGNTRFGAVQRSEPTQNLAAPQGSS
ncbi:hypothetical protein MMC13_003837 [Lambiella insularis]|nr:hypothetical protein [Lambiella insularis]